MPVLFARASQAELETIAAYEEECRNLILQGKDYTYADHNFHKAVAAAAHNSIYEKLLPMLHLSIIIILRSPEYISTAEKSKHNALIYHKMLVDCMKKNDVTGVSIAVKNHVFNAITYLKMHNHE